MRTFIGNFSSLSRRGFTLIELLAIVSVLALLASTLLPTRASTQNAGQSARCLNNHRQLAVAWTQYNLDHNDVLLAAQANVASRSVWVAGALDFNGGNRSNWDTNQDLAKSPLWKYLGQSPLQFRCPADRSTVKVAGIEYPRVRSISMSGTCGTGEWLDKSYNPNQSRWRIYDKVASIVQPAHTFVFADEHPDSINDAALVSACTGNEAADAPANSSIIDYPSNSHFGAGAFSFADTHVEMHAWVGTRVKYAPVTFTGTLPLNVTAGDSWVDMHWLAANTTVKR
jgi:type II secretory pathway pseudopilin PulG